METNHPRQETEQQRVYWRGKLRTWTEEKLERRGRIFPNVGLITALIDIVTVELIFPNGSIGKIRRIKHRQQEGVAPDKIGINIYENRDVIGARTQYISRA